LAALRQQSSPVDRATVFFWTLVAALLGASAFFTTGAWQYKQASRRAEVPLATGDLATLQSVVDGDTLVVTQEGGGQATVHLLGIRAFPSQPLKAAASMHGRAAEDALRRLIGNQPLRVLLNNPSKDRQGRTLATLFVGGEDLALGLLSRGHVLAYTVYPFAQMSAYLQAQREARQQQLGLWADPRMVERAEALQAEWARSAP
jgi:endonuclease YncB( thermonuclease family)